MKKIFIVTLLLMASFGFVSPKAAMAYNFGDFRSVTLTTKAWEALNQKDTEAVLAYTNKCLELYAEQAIKMQSELTDYPQGKQDEIFSYWALNDVATSLFIQGEAYRRADMKEEAKAVYKKLMTEFTYGQAWDTNGWFWKPAEAAKEKLAMIDSGSVIDFGDYSSAFITGQAWRALPDGDVATISLYTDKVVELYGEKARTMQDSLTEYPWQSREQIFNYWALNDVGTSLFIKAEALKKAGKVDEAKKVYKELIDKYFYSQCWDPQGWFWKPAEAAQQALDEMG
ncbi:MAG: hypothetical protein A2306_06105 [Omnitrophica WOR_2 bacterium RIFOXYB2_FULL_38_16]|nr:MAG: hypothetical protein A2243_02580 [Omnitrophica WOR_2 bacterium RIFOXYA2_FULL_38_17]OGX59837.1 MAG: hypothetical protein A2306_06105 [Omnitrophica WOR_2 bacterium RIFOXYB2_FULL_38_16]HBG62100.1 hypothetical protein [Candidatus Omnitrophota bacterium]